MSFKPIKQGSNKLIMPVTTLLTSQMVSKAKRSWSVCGTTPSMILFGMSSWEGFPAWDRESLFNLASHNHWCSKGHDQPSFKD